MKYVVESQGLRKECDTIQEAQSILSERGGTVFQVDEFGNAAPLSSEEVARLSQPKSEPLMQTPFITQQNTDGSHPDEHKPSRAKYITWLLIALLIGAILYLIIPLIRNLVGIYESLG